jgi:O-antigen/teichoic acid export membrane protein
MQFTEGIREEESFLKNIFNRFRRRDFSGTTGEAMKNSSYQLTQNLIFKFGSLFFTIVIARLLLPEVMGLYSLALSTIVLLGSFSDLGIGQAVITYTARFLGKKDFGKAKGYVKQLLQWKILLVSITSLILIGVSYFIAEYYYQKPIFYAILVGAIYIPVNSLLGFFENMFKSGENFRVPLFKELIVQVLRFVLVPLAIILFLKLGISGEGLVVVTISTVTFCYFIALLFLVFKSKRKLEFLKHKRKTLNEGEIKGLKKFIYPLSATALAGMFFANIDTLMLGHYVQSEFIAFYTAAFSLAAGATAIISFMSISLMPIFAKKTGAALENIFKKSRNVVVLISLFAGIFTYFVAYYIIRIVYGVEYLPAVNVLKIFAIMVALMPISGLFRSYFTTQNKTKVLAWLIIVSAVLNIVFNYFGINYGLKVGGDMGGVYGACIATVFSRVLYLGGLVVFRKR